MTRSKSSTDTYIFVLQFVISVKVSSFVTFLVPFDVNVSIQTYIYNCSELVLLLPFLVRLLPKIYQGILIPQNICP